MAGDVINKEQCSVSYCPLARLVLICVYSLTLKRPDRRVEEVNVEAPSDSELLPLSLKPRGSKLLNEPPATFALACDNNLLEPAKNWRHRHSVHRSCEVSVKMLGARQFFGVHMEL
jgi:hypothetical protein